MIRAIVEQTFDSTKKYLVMFGLSTDTKPTSGLITGSEFHEVDTGVKYEFDEVGAEWHDVGITEQEIKDEIDAWLDGHPEATTTVEDGAISYAKLDVRLKAAINDVEKYDDSAKIIKITSSSTTLGDINTILNGTGGVNPSGDHVFFDLSALGVMMYLCTIFLDTANGIYKVFDLVSGRYAEGTYNASTLLTMATAQANGLAVQSQIDNLQTQIDELGGKKIVANYDVLGDKILDGTSGDIIDPGDIMDVNWITSALGTTTSGLTVS